MIILAEASWPVNRITKFHNSAQDYFRSTSKKPRYNQHDECQNILHCRAKIFNRWDNPASNCMSWLSLGIVVARSYRSFAYTWHIRTRQCQLVYRHNALTDDRKISKPGKSCNCECVSWILFLYPHVQCRLIRRDYIAVYAWTCTLCVTLPPIQSPTEWHPQRENEVS